MEHFAEMFFSIRFFFLNFSELVPAPAAAAAAIAQGHGRNNSQKSVFSVV